MSDRLIGPRAKVERANELIADLETQINEFKARQPLRLIWEDESESGGRVYRIKILEEPGSRIGTLVGDVLHNLRSALELLAWQLVDANGGAPANERARQRIGFPISESAQVFETRGLEKVDGAGEKAKDLLRTIQPYKGGNDPLWLLHHLNSADKHRLIGLVAGATRSVAVTLPPPGSLPELAESLGVRVDQVPRMTIPLVPADRQFPLKDGAEASRVMKAARAAAGEDHPQITIDIALGQPGVLDGEPVIPLLRRLSSAVDETVNLCAPLLERTGARAAVSFRARLQRPVPALP